MAKPDDDHYERVVKYLIEGTVVPLLGAGVKWADFFAVTPFEDDWPPTCSGKDDR